MGRWRRRTGVAGVLLAGVDGAALVAGALLCGGGVEVAFGLLRDGDGVLAFVLFGHFCCDVVLRVFGVDWSRRGLLLVDVYEDE